MRAGARPVGQPRRTKPRTSEAHRGHRGRNQTWTFPRHVSTQHQSWLSVPLYPVFILLTITKAIYLFHLERTPCSGHLSLECSVAFLPPAPPWGVCASPGLFAGSCLSCVPTWAQGCLCLGPLTYSFQGALLRVPAWAPEGASASRAI